MKNRGLTVLEMLASITIIMILASMLLPALHGAREKGLQTKCLNNARNITDAIIQYALDNERYPTELAHLKFYHVDQYEQIGSSYLYAENISIGGPPSSSDTSAPEIEINDIVYYYDEVPEVLNCPKVRAENDISYGINESIRGMNLSQIEASSRIVAIVESDHAIVENIDHVVPRHVNLAIAGFLDGHVESFKEGSFEDIENGTNTGIQLQPVDEEVDPCPEGYIYLPDFNHCAKALTYEEVG